MDQDTLRKIAANAQLMIEILTPTAGFQLGYDEASVRYVEQFVLNIRPTADEAMIRNLSNKLGCYLGECIRHTYGGEWEAMPEGLGISFDARSAAYPANKIEKLFRHGAEDSIVSFYTLIPHVFAKVLRRPN